jgi:hypothetical protein
LREVQEAKANVQSLVLELQKARQDAQLATDGLRVEFMKEMDRVHDNFNRMVASIHEHNKANALEFREVDKRLNCHRADLNQVETEVLLLPESLLTPADVVCSLRVCVTKSTFCRLV